MVNFPQTRVDMHNMVGGSFDMSHEPHGSQAHGRIPYWVCLGPFGLCWDILGYVGQELGPYWACLGPFWAMLGHFGPCWNHIGLILGHFGLFSDLCRPLFWTRAFQRR